MEKNIWLRLGKWFMWIAGGIVALVILVFALIYLPFIQDAIIGKVLKSINNGSDTEIVAEKIRLKFPLRLEVRNLLLKQQGDTMVTLGEANARASMLPLLRKKVEINNLVAKDATFRMGNGDSAVEMRASAQNFNLSNTSVALKDMAIDISSAELSGGNISMKVRSDSTSTKPDSTSTSPLSVFANELVLRDIFFEMSLEGAIDTLSVNVPFASLKGGSFDMLKSDIYARNISIDNVDAKYILPVEVNQPKTKESDSTSVSAPWNIAVEQISLTNSRGLYAIAGAMPKPGLDMDYLQAENIEIRIDSFMNRGPNMRVPLRKLSLKERSGIELFANGVFEMDSVSMRANDFDISTGFSSLKLQALLGTGDLTTDASLPVSLHASASIAPIDVKMAFPTAAQIVSKLPQYSMLEAKADIDGTVGNLDISALEVAMPKIFSLSAYGNVANITDFDNIDGNVDLSGKIVNGRVVKATLLDAQTGKDINIPNLTLNGNVDMNKGVLKGRMKAVTDTGTIALNALWNNRREGYDATLKLSHFPVEAIMPGLGVRDLSAQVSAKGAGYDFFSHKTTAEASVDLSHMLYNDKVLTEIKLTAALDEGNADVNLISNNKSAAFAINAKGNLSPVPYNWALNGNVRNLDLLALGLATDSTRFSTQFSGNASINPENSAIAAKLNIATLNANLPAEVTLASKDINLDFETNDSLTDAILTHRDLRMAFNSPMALDSILPRVTAAMDSMTNSIARHRANVEGMQHSLPPFSLTLRAGNDNIINEYLANSKMSFNSLNASIENDSSISMNAKLTGLTTASMQLDTITLNINQINNYLTLEGNLNNAPGTFDQFAHVNLHGYVVDTKAGIFLRQSNINNEIGYRFGAVAETSDSIVRVNLVPYNPVIGYKPWTINSDNFVNVNLAHKHIDADLTIKNDESSIRLFTEHNDSIAGQEDINLIISNIQIADWIALNPFATPMKGLLSGNLRVGQHEDKMLNGKANVSLNDFYYGRERVGTFEIDADILTNAKGYLTADMALMVDGVKTITAYGALNDSTQRNPFLLDFRMIRFPLTVVNPFLPPQTAKLEGTLNGQMDITGSATEPIFNGSIDFEATSLSLNMLGTTFSFSDEKIPVDSNIVSFNNFTINGVNKNPLRINGTVDMKSLTSPVIDLAMEARNMQIVGTDRARKGAEVYGKAFINLDATVKGNLTILNADATLTVLSGTNATYIMTDAQSAIQSKSTGDMVRFVNFADTASLSNEEAVQPQSVMLNLDAMLNIEQGTTFNVDLSADGKNKVTLETNGALDYTMNIMNDSRTTGRINVTGGFVRYTPPLMSEKKFNFLPSSYVAFNGDMMNPILNIHAVDYLRANVTQTGQNSRLITFNIGLDITGTLNQMDVKFDLSTNDDITIQNELQSMSAEQRANQAMNLLLYNVYTGPGTKATSNIGGNALYSFLESQINSWAANNIKGVDLSFGINQYDQTTNGATSTATSYSYRVSKSLFNDRFKIVVGGNYTNDADPDQNIAQDLINDISFEYMLNKNGSMLVRLFRHTGFESILEGEITQTGVGFVYKRKIQSLGEMFKPFHFNRKSNEIPQQGNVLVPTTDATQPKTTDENSKQ